MLATPKPGTSFDSEKQIVANRAVSYDANEGGGFVALWSRLKTKVMNTESHGLIPFILPTGHWRDSEDLRVGGIRRLSAANQQQQDDNPLARPGSTLFLHVANPFPLDYDDDTRALAATMSAH